MSEVRFPSEFRLDILRREHPRKAFTSGNVDVDRWLRSFALQQQEKRLSSTKVLLHVPDGGISGYYTLATGQVDFGELPVKLVKRLPKRALPVAVLAWLGIHTDFQRQGLGERLLSQALLDCHQASVSFPFVAIIVDCIDDSAVRFYSRFDFALLPGHYRRMFLGYNELDAMLNSQSGKSL